MVEKQDQVFVISRIGNEGDPVRERADVIADYIVAPVAKEFGLKVDRSDRDATPGPITSRILRSLLASKVVVADLTGSNPNVFYELSFAHSFGLPVVILIDKAENLPFDVKNERVIPLGDDGSIGMQQGEVAKRRLRESFKIVLAEGYTPNSLVNEVANVQNIESMTPEDPVASELQAIKRRVDQIYSSMGASTSTSKSSSQYRQADVTSLFKFVESFVNSEKVTSEQLKSLVTQSTSDAFDNWVEEMLATYSDQISQADLVDFDNFDDIPF